MYLDFLKRKTVLVTGGTGFFGEHFVRKVFRESTCKKIIVFSRDEFKQHEMEQRFDDAENRLRFFLGDVRDVSRLRRAFSGVDIVVHAAALKQVPALEYNPLEAVKTNILGSQNVIEAAIDARVEKALLVSTDKSVQPISLYGSTKLCAEKLFVAGNAYSIHTKFSCVRYGNVIGSRGSIVETLLKNSSLVEVPMTDEKMTRFWIDLPGSFKLVLFALKHMEGGEIIVPKIPSMRLADLFEALVPKAKRKTIGIRAGEKLHEMLLTKEEARRAVALSNYFAILPEEGETFDVKKRFSRLLKTGKPLPADFYYSSDKNNEWLTKEAFQKLLKDFTIAQ